MIVMSAPMMEGPLFRKAVAGVRVWPAPFTLGPDATRDQVTAAMDGHILGKAVIEGRFHR